MDTNPDLSQIANGLVLHAPEFWVAKRRQALGEVSYAYPEIGNASCFTIEEDSFWFAHRNECILTVIRQFPFEGYLFDVGGGNGFVAQHLSKNQIPTAVVEPGAVGVQNARDRGIRPVIHATLEEAGFQPGVLPAVGLFDVIEHLEQPEQFLDLVADLLCPGGYLFLTVPAYQFLWSHEDDFAGHHRRYTRGGIQSLVQGTSGNSGLEVLFSTYFFALLPFPIFFLRTIPGRILKTKQQSEYAATAKGSSSSHRSGLQFVEFLLWWECTWIRRRWRIPFGGSCLVVAQKRT